MAFTLLYYGDLFVLIINAWYFRGLNLSFMSTLRLRLPSSRQNTLVPELAFLSIGHINFDIVKASSEVVTRYTLSKMCMFYSSVIECQKAEAMKFRWLEFTCFGGVISKINYCIHLFSDHTCFRHSNYDFLANNY